MRRIEKNRSDRRRLMATKCALAVKTARSRRRMPSSMSSPGRRPATAPSRSPTRRPRPLPRRCRGPTPARPRPGRRRRRPQRRQLAAASSPPAIRVERAAWPRAADDEKPVLVRNGRADRWCSLRCGRVRPGRGSPTVQASRCRAQLSARWSAASTSIYRLSLSTRAPPQHSSAPSPTRAASTSTSHPAASTRRAMLARPYPSARSRHQSRTRIPSETDLVPGWPRSIQVSLASAPASETRSLTS